MFSRLGTLFFDKTDSAFEDWLSTQIRADEHVLAIQKTTTEAPDVEAPVFLVVTDRRTVLCAHQDDASYWVPVEIGTPAKVENQLTSTLLVAGNHKVGAGRVGDGALKEVWVLAFLPRAELLLELALKHERKKLYQDANDLMQHAQDSADRAETNVAYLTVYERVLVSRARIGITLGLDPMSIALLSELSAHRPDDDLLEVATEHGIADSERWWLSVAVAHEECGDHASAARVYARLQLVADAEDSDIYILAEARALARAEDVEPALEAYERYIRLRIADSFPLVLPPGDTFEDSADGSLVDACMESGALLESVGRVDLAAVRYRTLIRNAPFRQEGYARLFALADQVEDDFAIMQAARVLSLLNPTLATQLTKTLANRADDVVTIPVSYLAIEDDDHDSVVKHPREGGAASMTQRWLGILLKDERDTADIERHCQRIGPESNPDTFEALETVARLAAVPTPRLFLSHGTTGIEVLAQNDPFVLLGATHLDHSSDRYLKPRELVFALASQVEHIRAGHLLLTSSEFWKTFGAKSLTTVLAFLPMGDLIGKFADSKLLSWAKGMKGTTERAAVQKMVQLAEERVQDGATAGGIQSAYTAALAAVNVKVRAEDQQESMVKESLADFARSALYTADRLGLLGCDDPRAAVRAILLLSPTSFQEVDRLEREGLQAVLATRDDDGNPVYEELILRFSELLKFALSDEYVSLRAKYITTLS